MAYGMASGRSGRAPDGAEPVRRSVVAACLGLLACPASAVPVFRDPLDTPAEQRSGLRGRMTMAATTVGARAVAVGPRGLIITSDDAGRTWSQSEAPVQSDLLAVRFVNDHEGWAVGHDSVILHTVDRGRSWQKQLDGRAVRERFTSFYQRAGADAQQCAQQITNNYRSGPGSPFLDVWFRDALHGFVVGPFGMLAATVDGGVTWEPWLHRIENAQYLNLNALAAVDGEPYIAGEQGKVYHLDAEHGKWIASSTGCRGNFFGIAGIGDVLLAFGLRGAIYRGQREGAAIRWTALPVTTDRTLSAGIARPDARGFLLADVEGGLLHVEAAGNDPHPIVPQRTPRHLTGLSGLGNDQLVLTSLEGTQVEAIPAAPGAAA